MKDTAFFAPSDIPSGMCACGPIIMPPELAPAAPVYPVIKSEALPEGYVKAEEFQEYMSAGCTAAIPAGARKMYLVMAAISTLIGAVIAFAIMNFAG